MRKIIALSIVAVLAWQGYQHLRTPSTAFAFSESTTPVSKPNVVAPAQSASFTCDGRIHCSQMKSCEEAVFFLRNCPGVKMDGDNDGVPCEQQWCSR